MIKYNITPKFEININHLLLLIVNNRSISRCIV